MRLGWSGVRAAGLHVGHIRSIKNDKWHLVGFLFFRFLDYLRNY